MPARKTVQRYGMKTIVHRFFPAVIFALILIAPACSYMLVKHGQVNTTIINDIEERVSSNRGLPFLKPVEIEVVSRKQASALFEKDFNEEYPPEKMLALERAYIRMGLIDAGLDFKKMALNYYTKNVAGFYDPKRKKLYLVKEVVGHPSILSILTQHDAMAELTMAHELTHALEDQHFDFEAMEEKVRDNDDAALAIGALGEGTATLVSLVVLYSPRINMEDMILALSAYKRMTEKILKLTAGTVPPIFLDSIIFAYADGTVFAGSLYKFSNSWDEVNYAYKHPPLSTEVVLYPEKYIKNTDSPIQISMAISPKVFGDDWIQLENNTLGEMGISSLLRRFVENNQARAAARGWAGDRYAVLGSPYGKKTLWIWVTQWDNDADAREFYSTYQAALKQKYKNIKKIQLPVENGECWENASGELIWLNRDGNRVGIIEGADRDTLPKAVKFTLPTVVTHRHENAPNIIQTSPLGMIQPQ